MCKKRSEGLSLLLYISTILIITILILIFYLITLTVALAFSPQLCGLLSRLPFIVPREKDSSGRGGHRRNSEVSICEGVD